MKDRSKQTQLHRRVWDAKNTVLGIGAWAWPYIDTSNWWMDAWKTNAWRYLHCPLVDGEGFEADGRVTRVYPREKAGRTVTLSMVDGVLFWDYSRTEAEYEAWLKEAI